MMMVFFLENGSFCWFVIAAADPDSLFVKKKKKIVVISRLSIPKKEK
jgi:hypothetical protein